MLCDPTDLIWSKGTPFEAMTGYTTPSSDGLLAEVLGFFSAVRQMPGNLCIVPGIISVSPLLFVTDVTDATLGASGLWLGTRTGAGGTATRAKSFFGRSPWLHGQVNCLQACLLITAKLLWRSLFCVGLLRVLFSHSLTVLE